MLSTINKGLNVAQKSRQEFSGIGHPFNPLTYDAANLLALYDGDSLSTDPANTWTDQSANGYDLTLFNDPAIFNLGLNGHDTLKFDGINQYAQNNNPGFLTTQPYTIYIVFNQITYTANTYFFDDGNVANNKAFLQFGGSPIVAIYAGSILTAVPNPPINNYEIITQIYNTINSEIRTNNNVAIIGDVGLRNGQGINLASQTGGVGNFCNCAIAYLIVRNGADNTATQNLFINWLKSRFAL